MDVGSGSGHGAPLLTPAGSGDEASSRASRRAPLWALALVALTVAGVLGFGLRDAAQTTVNGVISGSYLALAAIGLSLVYGIVRLLNLAHGDMLTLAAYTAFVFNVSLGLPIVPATALAIAVTILAVVALEAGIWSPMRSRGAGTLQLLLMTVGLAFVLRYGIQTAAGTQPRHLEVDTVEAIEVLGIRVGETQLVVGTIGCTLVILLALWLRHSLTGKRLRAIATNPKLAEVSGIDTARMIRLTWCIAGLTIGLAGVLLTAASGVLTPESGYGLLLPVFAAVILGGVGSAYGALAAGFVIGLTQEWAALAFAPEWKTAASFAVLIGVLLFRPTGIFGQRGRAV